MIKNNFLLFFALVLTTPVLGMEFSSNISDMRARTRSRGLGMSQKNDHTFSQKARQSAVALTAQALVCVVLNAAEKTSPKYAQHLIYGTSAFLGFAGCYSFIRSNFFKSIQQVPVAKTFLHDACMSCIGLGFLYKFSQSLYSDPIKQVCTKYPVAAYTLACGLGVGLVFAEYTRLLNKKNSISTTQAV